MEFLPLLGCNLASDKIAELLDQLNAEVVHQPDWLEGSPDCYGVNAIEQGVGLVFDKNQTLETIFLYPTFHSFDHSETDVPIFQSSAEVTAFADRNDLARTEGQQMVADKSRRWICLEWSGCSVHSEFIDDEPKMVVLARS